MPLRRSLSVVVPFLFLAGAIAAGCGGDDGPEPSDPGKPDAAVVARDGGLAADTSTASDAGDGGTDATVSRDAASDDAGDAGADATVGDAGSDAAGDAATVSDAAGDSAAVSDAAADSAAVSDAAADSATVSDAAADSATGADSATDAAPDSATDSDAGADAASETDAGTDAGEAEADAGFDAGEDAGTDAGSVAVGHPSYFGDTAAFITGGRQLALASDSVPAGSTVSVITQTYPKGTTASVHAVYATNPQFNGATDAALVFDKDVGNNEQWYAVLPAQPSGTSVVWYLYALGGDGTKLYDSGGGQNFHYSVP